MRFNTVVPFIVSSSRLISNFVLVLFFVCSTLGWAKDYIPPMPKDLSQVDVYLQTVGQGEQVYAMGGHTLLRIVDRVARTDVVFNWGVFDFNEPNFLLKFAKANAKYRMAAYSMRDNLAMYRYEHRSLVQERLNFTLLQKEAFMRAVIDSSQPENLYFRYHYYFANCSTKVFDMIDAGLNGNLTASFTAKMVSDTPRQALREAFNYFPYLQSTIDILMNSDVDGPMNQKQDSFLPLRLQKHLQQMPQYDDTGADIPGTKLLSEKTVLLDFPAPKPDSYWGTQVLFVLLVPVLLVGLVWSFKQGPAPWVFRLMGVASIVWGAISSFFGVILLLVWFWSEHEHGKHSANVLLLWPLDALWMYLGYRWLKTGTIHLSRHLRWLQVWLVGHIAILSISALLFVMGVIVQDVSRVWSELGPITVLLALFTLRFGISTR